MTPVNENLLKVLRLTQEMIDLADTGDQFRDDYGCGVIYGTLRDSAFKLRRMVEEERLHHIEVGIWKSESEVHNEHQARL